MSMRNTNIVIIRGGHEGIELISEWWLAHCSKVLPEEAGDMLAAIVEENDYAAEDMPELEYAIDEVVNEITEMGEAEIVDEETGFCHEVFAFYMNDDTDENLYRLHMRYPTGGGAMMCIEYGWQIWDEID